MIPILLYGQRLEYWRTQSGPQLVRYGWPFLIFGRMPIFLRRNDGPYSDYMIMASSGEVLAILGKFHCPHGITILPSLPWVQVPTASLGNFKARSSPELLCKEDSIERLFGLSPRANLGVRWRLWKARNIADELGKDGWICPLQSILSNFGCGFIWLEGGSLLLRTPEATQERDAIPARDVQLSRSASNHGK